MTKEELATRMIAIIREINLPEEDYPTCEDMIGSIDSAELLTYQELANNHANLELIIKVLYEIALSVEVINP